MAKVKKASNLTDAVPKNKTKKSEFKKKNRKERNNKKGLKLAMKNSTSKMKLPASNPPSYESVSTLNKTIKMKKNSMLSGDSTKKNKKATKKNSVSTKKSILQTEQHEKTKISNKRKQNRNRVVNSVRKNEQKGLKGLIKLEQNKGNNETTKLRNKTKRKKKQSAVKTKLETLQEVKERKKKKKRKNIQDKNNNKVDEEKNKTAILVKEKKLNVKRLEKMLAKQQEKQRSIKTAKKVQPQSLKERMMSKLKSSRFRYLNESLYNSQSIESKKYFKDDPDAFTAYHEGYRQQVEQWPLNPLDNIISAIKKLPKHFIVADFGCGEAQLAASIPQKVHSFDFIAVNDTVTACDMAHTPLLTNSVNIVVFCLSLMGSNLNEYLIEANRVLKKGGTLKIADVESRFEKVEDFIKTLDAYGFKLTWKDLSHNLFYFMDFNKQKDITTRQNKLPAVTLKPCLYKKR